MSSEAILAARFSAASSQDAISNAIVKQVLDQQKDVLKIVESAVQLGSQPLNSSGPGSTVNVLA